MNLRFSLPRVRGRGSGLGNELIPWARSFLIAQILGARSLPPAFGLNARRYWRHFGTPRYDWLAHRALQSLVPVVEFTRDDYVRHGAGDLVPAFRSFAEEAGLHDRHRYVVVTEGMWGGRYHLEAARDFVVSTLYRSRFAARNLLRVRRRLDPDKITVGMHVRLGDFAEPAADPEAYRGRFNMSLPLTWYRSVALSIHEEFGDSVQFLVISDGSSEALAPLLADLPAVTTSDIPDADCSDLLALVACDALVCSVSSYSLWAAFLSRAPYLWFEPHLQQHPGGFRSIWGHQELQRSTLGTTRASIERQASEERVRPVRGFPVGEGGRVPSPALHAVVAHHERQRPITDLVRYGAVRVDTLDTAPISEAGDP